MLSNCKKRESRGEIWDLFFPWHLAVAEAELVDLREGIELVADPPVADLTGRLFGKIEWSVDVDNVLSR